MTSNATAYTAIRPQPLIDQAKTPYQLKARDKAREFEAVFLSTFVKEMFAGIKTDGPFGGGHSETVYRSMLSKEYAKSLSASGGVGLADEIYRELIKQQQTETPK